MKSTTRTGRPVGRPKGSGKYGEETKAIRIPVSLLDLVEPFIERHGFVYRLYSDQIQAGFPSPVGDDAPFESYDIGKQLIPHPASTFFIRVTGESMRGAGVFPGDVLIVDRSLSAVDGDMVVAAVNGEFTFKRLYKGENRIELRPENQNFRAIQIKPDDEFLIWGVVKKVIHNV
ncbi:MAG: LexA family protein [Thermoguttaceae bacterium]